MDGLKLLLVDDETRFLETTQKVLLRKGVRVETASSGQEALRKLAVSDLSVVVLDVKMPGWTVWKP